MHKFRKPALHEPLSGREPIVQDTGRGSRRQAVNRPPARRRPHRPAGQFAANMECPHRPPPKQPIRRHAGYALAVQHDRSRGRPGESGDHIEERRIAGAIRADEPGDRALADIQAAIRGRADPAKALGNAADGKDRLNSRGRFPGLYVFADDHRAGPPLSIASWFSPLKQYCRHRGGTCQYLRNFSKRQSPERCKTKQDFVSCTYAIGRAEIN